MADPKRVVMVAAECVPFAKAGGLGDVIGALPVELAKLGVDVTVLLPRYRSVDLQKFAFQSYPRRADTRVPLGWELLPYDVHTGVIPGSSVKVFLIGNDRFFDRDGIYVDPSTSKDFPDQADRWIFFNRAVMDFLKNEYPNADVIHCHDHQTALIPAYLRRFYRHDGGFSKTRSVYTIHNMGYQGLFPREVMQRAGFDDAEFYPTSPFEFYGVFNFMKLGIVYADLVTTVSPTYAREIQDSKEYGYGLEGVLRERSRDVIGILNGIDVESWNPATDPLIAARYNESDLDGKQENRRALLREFGLDGNRLDRPILAVISRIDVQKGFDLLVSILDHLLNQDLHFLLLGKGNRETESYLLTIVERYSGKASIRFAFENRLAHITEAGSDILLMPSKYEPCGLNQMYSLRYGTVPVVRATGGLADTVVEFDRATGLGTGFRFGPYDPEEFRSAVDRALSVWPDRKSWQRLMRNGMEQDFSWRRSAGKYLELYTAFSNSASNF
jgi:starch synthase